MISLIPYNIFRLIALLAVQVLIFSYIHFSPFISPFVYPLFVLLLPFNTPRWLLLILGFVAGFILDLMLDTNGMHAASLLLVAYLRPYLITFITPKGAEFEVEPNIYLQGFSWFLIYCGVSTLTHHIFYFLIESWTFYNPIISLTRILVSTSFSVLFMMMFLYLFTSAKKRRMA